MKFQKYETNIYETYFYFNKSTKYSKITSKIILILFYLEFLIILIDFSLLNKNEEDNFIQFSSANFLKSIVQFISVNHIFKQNPYIYFTITIYLKIHVLLNLITFCILISDRLKYFHIKKIKSWFTFTAYFMIVVFPGKIFNMALSEIILADKFFTKNQYLLIIINSIILIITIFLGGFHCLFKKGENFNKEDFLNTIDKFFYLKIFLFKFVMFLLVKIIEYKFSKILYIIILIIFGLIILYLFIGIFRKQIFDKTDINIFSNYLICLIFAFWISLFCLTVFSSYINILFFFIFFSLLLCLLNFNVSQNYRRIILSLQYQNKNNLEEKINFLQNLVSNYEYYDEIMLKGIFVDHDIKCVIENCFCKSDLIYNAKNYQFSESNRITNHKTYILYLIQEMIKNVLLQKNKKKNHQNFLLINYYFKKMHNYLQTIITLNKMLTNNLGYFDLYEVLAIKKGLDNKLNTIGLEKFDEKSIEEFIHYDDTYNLLETKIKSLLTDLNNFWVKMDQTQLHLSDEMIKLQFEIIENKNKCKQIWKGLKRYFRQNSFLEFYHQVFQKEFLNQKMHLNVEKIFSKKQKFMFFQNGSLEQMFGENYYKYFFDPYSCVIQISLGENEIGNIIRTNKNISNLFGYSQSELTGNNISMLIPKGMKQIHQEVLIEMKSQGKLLHQAQNMEVIALDQNEEPIPIKLFYKLQITPKIDINLISFLCSTAVEENFPFILTDQNGFIISFSSILEEILNLKLADLKQTYPHLFLINKIFSNFFQLLKLDSSENIEQDSDQQKNYNFEQEEILINQFYEEILTKKQLKKFYKILLKLDLKAFTQGKDQLQGSQEKELLMKYKKKFIDETSDPSLSKLSNFFSNQQHVKNFQETLKQIYKEQSEYNENLDVNYSIRFEHVLLKTKHLANHHIFYIKKLYKIQNKQKNMIILKYDFQKKAFFKENQKLVEKFQSIENNQNKKQTITVNLFKQDSNIFHKNKENFPKKKLPSVQQICIGILLLFFVFIFFESVTLAFWQIPDLNRFQQNYETFYLVNTLVKQNAINYNFFLNIFLPGYPDNYKEPVFINNNLTKILLEQKILRTTLINSFEGIDYPVNLFDDDKIYQVNFFYLLNSYLNRIFVLEQNAFEMTDSQKLYKIFLNTYKKNLFDINKIIDPIFDKNENDINDSLKKNKYINIGFYFVTLIGCFLISFYLILKSYKNIQVLFSSFQYMEKKMVFEILNYYKNLTEFMNFVYFSQKIVFKIDQVKKQESIKDKAKNIILSKKDNLSNSFQNQNLQQYFIYKQKIKKYIIFLGFIIFIGIIIGIKLSLEHAVIYTNLAQLQSIGKYVLTDFWKLPSLIMNGYEVFFDNTSFNIMGENYKSLFLFNNELDIGNFYAEKFEIGQIINKYYTSSLCDMKFIVERLKTFNDLNCPDFFNGLLTTNMINIKRFLQSNLMFMHTGQDPAMYNYTVVDVPNYDKTQIFVTDLMTHVVTEWWNSYLNYLAIYKRYFIIFAIIFAFIMMLMFFMIKYFVFDTINKEYELFRKIYLHFIPVETLEKNKLIGVKLNESNILNKQNL